MTPEKELLVRLAILVKKLDPSGRASGTATLQKLSVEIVDVLMDSDNHAKYLKLSKEVDQELKGETAKATSDVRLREAA